VQLCYGNDSAARKALGEIPQNGGGSVGQKARHGSFNLICHLERRQDEEDKTDWESSIYWTDKNASRVLSENSKAITLMA
jgi:hypothetical protein